HVVIIRRGLITNSQPLLFKNRKAPLPHRPPVLRATLPAASGPRQLLFRRLPARPWPVPPSCRFPRIPASAHPDGTLPATTGYWSHPELTAIVRRGGPGETSAHARAWSASNSCCCSVSTMRPRLVMVRLPLVS